MIDIWTKAVLAGAAVSFAAYLAMRHARRIACVSDWLVRVHRSHLAAFLLFAAIATVCAQKGGNTNGVGQVEGGTNGVQMVGGGIGMMGVGNGGLRMENGGVVAVGDSTILHSPLYILHSVTTNETYSYAMPPNATRYEKWWRRGKRECKMENVEWRMRA